MMRKIIFIRKEGGYRMRIQKKHRLTAAAVLAASTVVTIAPSYSHANSMFKDVSPSDSYYRDLVELVNQGIVSGYADKTFKPTVAVTRGHFAQMLAQLLELDTSNVNDPYLSDVTSSNPFYKYIAALADAGVDVSYTDGSFKPNQNIKRIEAAQMLTEALDLKATNTDTSSKSATAIKAVVQNGLMKSPTSTNFNSNGTITRAEVVSLLTSAKAFQQDEGTFTFNSLNSTGKVNTSKGTYSISPEMKKIFNPDNEKALSNAKMKAVISNGQIIKVTGITFNQSGYTSKDIAFNANGAKIEGNVYVNADYLRLQNMTINGNVTVNDDAATSLVLNKITVKQSVIIEDGPLSAFKFIATNSTIPQLYVKRDKALINTDKKITAVVLEGDVEEVALNTRVGKVTVTAAPGIERDITGYATIDEVIVERGADVKLLVNGTLAKLEVVHGESKVYSNQNLLISEVLIPNGTDYKDIIRDYSRVDGYIMSVKRPDSTENLLGIKKVPNIPDGALHPGDGGGDGSNTSVSFEQAVERAVSSFRIVPSGKSVVLTANFSTMNKAIKTALDEATYNYRIQSTNDLPETASYTLEIKRGSDIYTATVTGKQLNESIKLEYLILTSLGNAVDMDGLSDTWEITVKTLNGTLDLKADLLIEDTVAESAKFALTGTDTNIATQTAFDGFDVTFSNNVKLNSSDATAVNNLLKVVTDFSSATDIAGLGDKLLDAKIKLSPASSNYNVTVYYNGDKVTGTGATDGKITLTAGSTNTNDIQNGAIKLSAILKKINPDFQRNSLKSELNKFDTTTNLDKKDTWEFVIERGDGIKQENVAATIELILTEPAVGTTPEKDETVFTRSGNMTLNKPTP